MKIKEFDMKVFHIARYGLILRQDGAIWLRIIFKHLLSPTHPWKGETYEKNENPDLGSFVLYFVLVVLGGVLSWRKKTLFCVVDF